MRITLILLAVVMAGCDANKVETVGRPPAASAVAAPASDAAPAKGPAVADVTPSAAYKEQVFALSDLMVGGTRIEDPLRHGVVYYLAPQWLLWQGPNNPVNYGKQSGLFISKDGGKAWQVFSRQFDYKHFYVHPLTGEFFAIIGTQWQRTGDDGFLSNSSADKIIRSTDGKKWIDITHGPGYVADLTEIFQDPDHPNRICVIGCIVSIIFFQYTDDDYSDWKTIRESTWLKTHPAARPSK